MSKFVNLFIYIVVVVEGVAVADKLSAFNSLILLFANCYCFNELATLSLGKRCWLVNFWLLEMLLLMLLFI